MSAAKRARQKANRSAQGRHTAADHVPGETCRFCKPAAATQELTAGQASLVTSPLASVPGGWPAYLAQVGKSLGVTRRG